MRNPREQLAAGRSIRSQHKLIAEALICLGHTSRTARLEKLSAVTRRPVAAFADLSAAEATAALLALGTELGAKLKAENPAARVPGTPPAPRGRTRHLRAV